MSWCKGNLWRKQWKATCKWVVVWETRSSHDVSCHDHLHTHFPAPLSKISECPVPRLLAYWAHSRQKGFIFWNSTGHRNCYLHLSETAPYSFCISRTFNCLAYNECTINSCWKNEPNQDIDKYNGRVFPAIDFFSACITKSMSMDSTWLVPKYNAHNHPEQEEQAS